MALRVLFLLGAKVCGKPAVLKRTHLGSLFKIVCIFCLPIMSLTYRFRGLGKLNLEENKELEQGQEGFQILEV